jgi:hypothetical protein
MSAQRVKCSFASFRNFSGTEHKRLPAGGLLHQASRRKDQNGQVVAEIEDYAVVRELIADLVAVGVDATVVPHPVHWTQV